MSGDAPPRAGRISDLERSVREELARELSQLSAKFVSDQQSFTAVDRFSRWHSDTPHVQEKYYKNLIPLEKPGADEQYAFEVDLDRCTGCKACVVACHNLNGLDEDETWRSVGLLVGGNTKNPYQQTVTTACHHCAEPGCMQGCPVEAYEKVPETGIVRHLDDQCIGCQYCILKCPYDVPKYSEKRGIVRKCDMCHSRLAKGEAPACVQSCPTMAIKITVVNMKERTAAFEQSLREGAAVAQLPHGTAVVGTSTAILPEGRVKTSSNRFLPASPKPDYTVPSTVYKTTKGFPKNTHAADYRELHTEHAHTPLANMLVLTQAAAGLFTANAFFGLLNGSAWAETAQLAVGTLAALIAVIGINASLFHLGRPLYAFRAILGWKTSWLSREILAFGAFGGAAVAYAAVLWLPKLGVLSPEYLPKVVQYTPQLGFAAAGAGLLGVFTSVMVYVDCRKPFWAFPWTFSKFFLTALSLGHLLAITTAIAACLYSGKAAPVELRSFAVALCVAAMGFAMLKQAVELGFLRKYRVDASEYLSPLNRSALLMSMPEHLGFMFRIRMALGILGGFVLPLALMLSLTSSPVSNGVLLGMSLFALLAGLAGEWIERMLFFMCAASVKMPGGPAK